MVLNPFTLAQTLLISDMHSLSGNIRWPDHYRDYYGSLALISVIVISYIIAGILFAWRAKCRFRKGIF